MSEIISCPSCRRKLQVPEALLGQDVQCPTCAATFVAGEVNRPPPVPSSRGPGSGSSGAPGEPRSERDWERLGYRRQDMLPHRGGLIMTLGLVSLVPCFGIFVAPFAWLLGQHDLNEMTAGRMDPEGLSSTTAGKICGIISTAVHALLLLLAFCLGIADLR